MPPLQTGQREVQQSLTPAISKGFLHFVQNDKIAVKRKCIKILKATSESEGYHNNHIFKDRKFKGARVDIDSIYLTREELDKMM